MESRLAVVMGQRVQLMNQRAMFAVLLDKFHLTPEDIAKLTDRQIFDYYFHPRDNHGSIKTPEAVVEASKAEGYEQNMIALKSLLDAGFVNTKDFQRLKEELEAKYGEGRRQ